MTPSIKNPLDSIRSNSSVIFDTNIWLQRIDPTVTVRDYSTTPYEEAANIELAISEFMGKNIQIYILPTIISEIINVSERNNFKTWRSENKETYPNPDYKRDYRDNKNSSFIEDNKFIWQTINEEILYKENVSLFNIHDDTFFSSCLDYCKAHPQTDFNDVLIVHAAKATGSFVFSQDNDLKKMDLDFTLYSV